MNHPKKNILLLYTGGTIGMVKDTKTNALKPLDFSTIKKSIPELHLLNCSVQTKSFEKPIDSSNIKIEHIQKIAQFISHHYHKFDGFVILTGSDTMAYIASLLSFMFENLKKPVIFTGSQLPIGDVRTDAKENMITAIQIAGTYEQSLPVVPEVCIYFGYKLYRGNRASKIDTEQFEAFDSHNYPPLAESGVHLIFNHNFIHKAKPIQKSENLEVQYELNQQVMLLKIFPGILPNIMASVLKNPNLKALVLETYGTGNAPLEAWFIALLQEAITKGIHIVNVTQCKQGSVSMGQYKTSEKLKAIGVINGKNITSEAALAKLMYLLGKKTSKSNFKKKFETSLRGEIS